MRIEISLLQYLNREGLSLPDLEKISGLDLAPLYDTPPGQLDALTFLRLCLVLRVRPEDFYDG